MVVKTGMPDAHLCASTKGLDMSGGSTTRLLPVHCKGRGRGKWGDVRNLRAMRVSITWVKDEAPHVCTCVPWIVHYVEARLGVELNTFYVYVW